jgi:ABC-type transport system substrate-binding protein
MYDYYDIDINNNLWPTSNVDFRRAIAYLVNYEQFYTTVLRAYSGTLMNSIIWSEWTKWYNPNAKKYSYSPNTAKSILDAAGFKDWDADGDREYKNETGTYDLPPLIFYAREDDPFRKSLGDMIDQELTANGIPVEYHVASGDTCTTCTRPELDRLTIHSFCTITIIASSEWAGYQRHGLQTTSSSQTRPTTTGLKN